MANPDLAFGALLKPLARQDAAERKYARRQARRAEKTAADRENHLRQSMIRIDVYRRDAGRCRAFGRSLKLADVNPASVAHCHHLIYRSAGGSDEPHNRVTLSPEAHRLEHDHKLRIDGDPNGTLIFTRVEPETGKVLERWESPCPTAEVTT